MLTTDGYVEDLFGGVGPPPTIYRTGVEPFSPAEIDAHPDSVRIWATIEAMRQRADDAVQDVLDCDEEVRKDDRDAAWGEGYAQGAKAAKSAIAAAVRGKEHPGLGYSHISPQAWSGIAAAFWVAVNAVDVD